MMYSDFLSMNFPGNIPELVFDRQGHVIAVPALYVTLPSVLKTAEKCFYRDLSADDRSRFRRFCRDTDLWKPVFPESGLLLSLHGNERFSAVLAVCRDEGSVTVRFIRRPWDLYDPSLPILKGLSGIAGEFCYACLNLDRDLAYGTYVPADSSAGGMFCGYLAETAENIRNSGDCLCDLRQITGFLLDSLRESALFSDMDILFSDPTDNCGALIIPLHLSGLTYAFLLLMRMMGDLSTDGQVEVSLLTYEDRVDFRFACTSNLAASHLRYNRSFSGASEAVPGLRGPAELFSALCARHSFTAELLKNRGTLLCTVTVHEFTEHQPDFKFNDPMARIREFFSEALHVLSCLADVSEHQEGEAKGL